MKYWDKHKSKLTHERYAVNGIGSQTCRVSCERYSGKATEALHDVVDVAALAVTESSGPDLQRKAAFI